MPVLPFKLNQARRHQIPRRRHKVTNWLAYEPGLCQRGSLTVWFTSAGRCEFSASTDRQPRVNSVPLGWPWSYQSPPLGNYHRPAT